VLWVGVDCAPAAASLHRGLATAAAASGLSVAAESTFRPHLTLARCPKPWAIPDAERLAPEYDEPLGPQFLAAEAVLYESELRRGGARHLPYARLPLGEVAC
jgi:2'-5' RNA ligase